MSVTGNGHRAPPKLWRALVLAAIIPIVLIGLFLWLSLQFDQLSRQHANVERAYERQAAIAALISEVKDAETAQRGYVITGNTAFLLPYQAARETIDEKLARLNQLFGDESPAIRERVTRISALVPDKFGEMDRVLETHRREGGLAAAQMVSQGTGKRLMDEIDRETAAIAEQQNRFLAAQRATASEQAEWGRQLYFVAVLLVTAFAFWVAYLIWMASRGRHRALIEAIDAGHRQAAIFNSALNAVILINPSGSIEVMNPAAERLFGYPATDLVRRDIAIIADLAPGEGPFLERLGLRGDTLDDPFRPLLQARRANGETLPVEVALGIMPLEDGMHIVAVFSDITEREKIEQMKDQFLSTVSHELRTPLTSIVGSLGLLRAGAADALAPQAQRLVEIAENNANRLIRIVNDILDAEKLQSGQMAFTMAETDLQEVVGTAVAGMSGLAATRHIDIEVHAPNQAVIVRGDGERLVQVVNNLLSNAIKFSPSGGRVDVWIAQVGRLARVSIADQGAGIPQDLRGRLFNRFAQATGGGRSGMPGTGLGLTISRDIVRYHGGTIGFADGMAGGTVFTFDLPLIVSGPAAQDASLNGTARLLLYTDAAEAQALDASFAAQAIRADVVRTEVEAVAAVRQNLYLAMIVDFQFGGEKAPPMIQAVRAEPRGRCLPIIGIAGETPQVDPRDTAAIDIIDWLEKPIRSDKLNDAVAAAINRASVEMPLVLHVDDDRDTLEITAAALAGLARVEHAGDLATARAFLAAHRVDILIVDIALPDGSGLDLVTDLGGVDGSGIPVIIYSAQDGGSHLREVEAVLTKSRKSLPNLVETILAIRDKREREGG